MTQQHGVRGPRLEFETLLAQMVSQAEEMMSSQSRLRDLIRVNHVVTSDLDLDSVLRRIVEMSTELIGARYAAMGVISDDGGLEQFIHVGIDDAAAEHIGDLPEGKGLLGAIIDDPRPVSLDAISGDPRSVGFPDNHPPMESFLGVPIRVRDEVYGNLYLTNSSRGSFSPDDVELAQSLAATAGIAIANARQFDDAQYRERWSSALADAARLLLADEDGAQIPDLLQTVRRLAEADMVGLCAVDVEGGTVRVDDAVGDGSSVPVRGVLPDPDRRIIGPILAGEPAIVVDLAGSVERDGTVQPYLADVVVVPFAVSFRPGSALWVARGAGRLPFKERDLAMIQSFTNHVTVTLDRAEVRRTRRRVAMLEDRSRIARDLHDHVIQRLFATGLSLQATAARVEPDAAGRLSVLVQEIDAAITQIRHSIFALNQDVERSDTGLRSRILAVVARIGEHLPRQPTVMFVGPVDLMTDADLAGDVEAVVSEALTNAVRHAQAEAIAVEIAIEHGTIHVTVTDDGIGPGSPPRRSGLANLEERALQHDGASSISAGADGGTVLHWRATLGT